MFLESRPAKKNKRSPSASKSPKPPVVQRLLAPQQFASYFEKETSLSEFELLLVSRVIPKLLKQYEELSERPTHESHQERLKILNQLEAHCLKWNLMRPIRLDEESQQSPVQKAFVQLFYEVEIERMTQGYILVYFDLALASLDDAQTDEDQGWQSLHLNKHNRLHLLTARNYSIRSPKTNDEYATLASSLSSIAQFPEGIALLQQFHKLVDPASKEALGRAIYIRPRAYDPKNINHFFVPPPNDTIFQLGKANHGKLLAPHALNPEAWAFMPSYLPLLWGIMKLNRLKEDEPQLKESLQEFCTNAGIPVSFSDKKEDVFETLTLLESATFKSIEEKEKPRSRTDKAVESKKIKTKPSPQKRKKTTPAPAPSAIAIYLAKRPKYRKELMKKGINLKSLETTPHPSQTDEQEIESLIRQELERKAREALAQIEAEIPQATGRRPLEIEAPGTPPAPLVDLFRSSTATEPLSSSQSLPELIKLAIRQKVALKIAESSAQGEAEMPPAEKKKTPVRRQTTYRKRRKRESQPLSSPQSLPEFIKSAIRLKVDLNNADSSAQGKTEAPPAKKRKTSVRKSGTNKKRRKRKPLPSKPPKSPLVLDEPSEAPVAEDWAGSLPFKIPKAPSVPLVELFLTHSTSCSITSAQSLRTLVSSAGRQDEVLPFSEYQLLERAYLLLDQLFTSKALPTSEPKEIEQRAQEQLSLLSALETIVLNLNQSNTLSLSFSPIENQLTEGLEQLFLFIERERLQVASMLYSYHNFIEQAPEITRFMGQIYGLDMPQNPKVYDKELQPVQPASIAFVSLYAQLLGSLEHPVGKKLLEEFGEITDSLQEPPLFLYNSSSLPSEGLHQLLKPPAVHAHFLPHPSWTGRLKGTHANNPYGFAFVPNYFPLLFALENYNGFLSKEHGLPRANAYSFETLCSAIGLSLATGSALASSPQENSQSFFSPASAPPAVSPIPSLLIENEEEQMEDDG